MIYDCFTFFNELDMLEIRLNVLKDVVDRFVLVEATRTFTNHGKELVYQKNKYRFENFEDRIIHIVVDDFPEYKTPWHYESHQRNAILRGLKDAKPDDVIIIGDVDELPSPEMVTKYAGRSGITAFRQRYYSYYLNYLNVRQQHWYGSKMLSYHDFRHVFDGIKTINNEIMPQEVNEGTTPSKVRMRTPPFYRAWTRHVRNGGWHFTNLGGAENLLLKMKSFSHQEYNPGDDKIDVGKLSDMIASGSGPFWKMQCFAVPIDSSFPRYIQNYADRFSSLVFPVTEEYVRAHRMSKLIATMRGYLICACEMIVPSVLHNFLHLCKVKLRTNRFYREGCS